MTPEELGLSDTNKGREEVILRIVTEQGGNDPIRWVTLRMGDRLELRVMADTLKIKGVRLNVTAETAQHLADHFGACLPTAKILDQIWLQREVTLSPCTQKINSTTRGMIAHSDAIDRQLKDKDAEGKLVSTLGKHWILDADVLDRKKLNDQAVNYGWHWTRPQNGSTTATLIKNPSTGQYYRMIQSRGWHHNIRHVDYSQVLRLVARDCILDGERADFAEILTSSELFSLVLANHHPLESHRHPFVPQKYMGMTVIA